MKLVHLSIQSSNASVMADPLSELRARGIETTAFCMNHDVADNDILKFRELSRESADADMVFIRVMSDAHTFKMFDRYIAEIRGKVPYIFVNSGNVEVTLLYRDLFAGTDDDFRRLQEFAIYKGYENDIGIWYWLSDRLGLTSENRAPVKQRTDGVYHPDFPRDVTIDDYGRNLDTSRPTIGIMFTSHAWMYGNLEHIDALIRSVECHGCNTIPVFFAAASTLQTGDTTSKHTVERYFIRDGVVTIDALMVCSPFSQLVNSRITDGLKTPDGENFYKNLLDVPVFQAMTVSGEYRDYESCAIGLNKNDISMMVAWPEVDGQIISVPIGHSPPSHRSMKKTAPLPDRINHISRLATNWAKMRRKPTSERRIAILMYQYTPDQGRIGVATGLDVPESVVSILKAMEGRGYKVGGIPADGRELIVHALSNVTNDLGSVSSKFIEEKAAGLVTAQEYSVHYAEVSGFVRDGMEKQWGEPVGDVGTDRGRIVIPGMVKGNIYVGYQPLRATLDKADANYHSPIMMSTHQYLEFYRWLRDVFRADAVIHMGTHGTLEWLPGKNVGLSSKCSPDLILDAMPHIYPYVIDDPGEGIQAKRRSEAVVIGHMCPPMSRGGTYDDLAQTDQLLQEYFKIRNIASGERYAVLVGNIYDAAKKINLLDDLRIEDTGPEGFTEHLDRLHDYITEVKDALIRNGLHVQGRIPEGPQMADDIYSLMRLRNGEIPSMRDSLAATIGSNPEDVDSEYCSLINSMIEADFEKNRCLALLERYSRGDSNLGTCVSYVCDTLVPNLRKMDEEIENMLDAMEGRYVLPGPSGAPTRGNAHILPMGRNYYGLDPDTVPSRSAWEIGRKMADNMIEAYVSEKGTYPGEIGFVIWATDTMKTGGDDVAYILWLMGIRPIWAGAGGQVTGLEVVPLSELKRPRLDVTVNITGLFRDAFPNLIDMIDDAVSMVANLDEDEEDNYLAANLRRDVIEGIKGGLGVDEARKKASIRMFGAPPGGYGTGVTKLIENSSWKTVDDLADIYRDWCGHGYGRGMHGESMKGEFTKRFSRVAVTVKNMPDREIDLLDCDDVYAYLGGMNSFVRTYGRKDATSYIGDDSDPDKVKLRKADEELKFVFRSKVLNPKYIEGMKRHGYRGAAELVNVTEYAFAWGATSDIMEDWMYDGIAEKYVLNEDMREWLKDENPFAMLEMLNRLQEAISRGMWDASPEMRERLKKAFIEAEERVEEVSDR